MSAKFFLIVSKYVRDWLRLRAERKSMLMATDEISHSPDDVLSDIGISRDDIISASQNCRKSEFPPSRRINQ